MQVISSLAMVHKARLRQSLQEWRSMTQWRVEMKGICRRMIARTQHRHVMICVVTWQEAAGKARQMRWCGTSTNYSTMAPAYLRRNNPLSNPDCISSGMCQD